MTKVWKMDVDEGLPNLAFVSLNSFSAALKKLYQTSVLPNIHTPRCQTKRGISPLSIRL